MPRVIWGMDGLMSKTRDRAELEARRLDGARLLQRGVKPAEVARRLKVSRTSVWRWERALATNGRPARRQARGGREEAVGRSARSRRLGARICHRFVDAGAGGQAHRKDQRQTVFGVRRVAAHQGAELLLPAAERPR